MDDGEDNNRLNRSMDLNQPDAGNEANEDNVQNLTDTQLLEGSDVSIHEDPDDILGGLNNLRHSFENVRNSFENVRNISENHNVVFESPERSNTSEYANLEFYGLNLGNYNRGNIDNRLRDHSENSHISIVHDIATCRNPYHHHSPIINQNQYPYISPQRFNIVSPLQNIHYIPVQPNIPQVYIPNVVPQIIEVQYTDNNSIVADHGSDLYSIHTSQSTNTQLNSALRNFQPYSRYFSTIDNETINQSNPQEIYDVPSNVSRNSIVSHASYNNPPNYDQQRMFISNHSEI